MEIVNPVQDENLKNFRHNYIVNVLDGGFFWLSYSFIAPSVILPLYVSHFTSNKFVIGFVAVLASMGYFLPQLLTSNWVEQVPVKKFLPVNIGFFTERLPVLFLPFTVLLALPNPGLGLSLMLLLFAWHSFGAGVVAVGWNSMLAKVIPVEKRGIFMGLTTFSGNATGIIGASLAAYFLNRLGFPYGFMICFALAAVSIFISWFFLAQTREEPDVISKQPVSTRTYWKELPVVLSGDRNLQRYLLTQMFIGLGGMAWGFLAVYTVDTWSLSDGKVGTFTTALLVGQTIANIFFGFLGDKRGFKLVIAISLLLAIASLIVLLITVQPDWMYLVFGLRGASAAGLFIAGMIVYEFSTAEKRPTYVGLNNTWVGILQFIAPLMGGLLAQYFGYPALFSGALLFLVVGILVLLFWFKEPRTLDLYTATK